MGQSKYLFFVFGGQAGSKGVLGSGAEGGFKGVECGEGGGKGCGEW